MPHTEHIRLPDQSQSPWMGVTMPPTTTLTGDVRADVIVIGAGVAGLTTAYLLQQEGYDVVVVEANGIGSGETSRSTAHLASWLDDGIARIEKVHGADATRRAVRGGVAAIDRIERIVRQEQVDCQFERLSGYLWRAPRTDVRDFENEYFAIRRSGLTDADMVDRAPIDGFESGRAIRFPNQATLHPMKYLAGIASVFLSRGGRIFTDTRAEPDFHQDHWIIALTTAGHRMRARFVVVASNSPSLDFLKLDAQQSADRTYVVGIAVENRTARRALYWDTDKPYHYVRFHRDIRGERDILLVGGGDHRTGTENEPEARWRTLESWARSRFKGLGDVTHQWSGQVLEPADGLPFIGRSHKHPALFCITGDSGQGMTHGTLGAMIVADRIAGRDNLLAHVYSPSRLRLRSTPRLVAEFARSGSHLGEYLTPGEVDSVDDIEPGAGAIVRRGMQKIAAYRDHKNVVHERSAKCTHMGCIVHWNSGERTWDCPCHGSRFAADGGVINGPATEPLRAVEPATDTRAPHELGDAP